MGACTYCGNLLEDGDEEAHLAACPLRRWHELNFPAVGTPAGVRDLEKCPHCHALVGTLQLDAHQATCAFRLEASALVPKTPADPTPPAMDPDVAATLRRIAHLAGEIHRRLAEAGAPRTMQAELARKLERSGEVALELARRHSLCRVFLQGAAPGGPGGPRARVDEAAQRLRERIGEISHHLEEAHADAILAVVEDRRGGLDESAAADVRSMCAALVEAALVR